MACAIKYLGVIEPGVRMIILPKLIEKFLIHVLFHIDLLNIFQDLSDGSDSFDTKIDFF